MSPSGLSPTEVIDLLNEVRVDKKGSQRAPHKHLLLLLILARIQRGENKKVRYSEIQKPLEHLLVEFGPKRKTVLQEYPFWYLQSDGFWKVMDADHLQKKKGKDIPLRTEFDKYDPVGVLREDIEEQLRADPQLVSDAAKLILQRNFPSSIHAEIASEAGLVISDEVRAVKKKRDPAFRGKVLRAYRHCCAVCSFDLRFGHSDLALEAAHIKWHQVGGPDIESNGLALCSMHHKMLDRGAFTVSNDYQIIVSQEVCGSAGLVEYLLRFHGKPLQKPQSQEYVPDLRYIRWHQQQVFRSPGRQL